MMKKREKWKVNGLRLSRQGHHCFGTKGFHSSLDTACSVTGCVKGKSISSQIFPSHPSQHQETFATARSEKEKAFPVSLPSPHSRHFLEARNNESPFLSPHQSLCCFLVNLPHLRNASRRSLPFPRPWDRPDPPWTRARPAHTPRGANGTTRKSFCFDAEAAGVREHLDGAGSCKRRRRRNAIRARLELPEERFVPLTSYIERRTVVCFCRGVGNVCVGSE